MKNKEKGEATEKDEEVDDHEKYKYKQILWCQGELQEWKD